MARGVSPITWSNVAAPTGGAALSAFNQAGQNLGNAISGVGDSLKTGAQDYADSQTADFLNDLNAERDPAVRQQMIDASSAFLDNKQVNEAQTANLKEDRTATTFANAQKVFGQGQLDREHMLKQRPILEGYAAQDQGIQNADALRQRDEHFQKKVIERENTNRYRKTIQLKAPLPAYTQADYNAEFGGGIDASLAQGSSVQAAVAALQPKQSQALVAPAPAPASSVASTSLDAAQGAVPPEFSPEQQAAIDSGSITPEQIRQNIQINQIASNISSGTVENPAANSADRMVANAKFAETGERGAIPSDDPNSSAEGSFQVIDANLTTPPFGILPQQSGESKADAKERIGEAMVRGALSKYNNVPRAAASHRFGDAVARNWDGQPSTLEAAVNEFSDLSPAKKIKALEEWDTYLGRWENGNPKQAVDTSVAQAKQALVKPKRANLLSDIRTPFKNVGREQAALQERERVSQEFGEWALAKSGYDENKEYTTNEIYKMLNKGTSLLAKDAGAVKARSILASALQSRNIDVSNLRNKREAQAATNIEVVESITNDILDGSKSVKFDAVAESKKTGVAAKLIGEARAPMLVNTLETDMLKELSADILGSTPYTDTQSGDTQITEKGVDKYNEVLAAWQAKYPYVSKRQWDGMEHNLNQALDIDRTEKRILSKKANKVELLRANVAHSNSLEKERVKNRVTTHNIESVEQQFENVPRDEIKEVLDALKLSEGYIALGRNTVGQGNAPDIKGIPAHDLEWIAHEAMKLVATEDKDSMLFGLFGATYDIETTPQSDIADQFDTPGTKANAILAKINELVAQKYRVNRGEVVTDDGVVHALKGNMFDIIKYSKKS